MLQPEDKAPRELFREPNYMDARAFHSLLPSRAAQQRAREVGGCQHAWELAAQPLLRVLTAQPGKHHYCSSSPAYRNIDRSFPTRGQSERDSQRRQDLGETSDETDAEQPQQVLFQQKQFRIIPCPTSVHGSYFPWRAGRRYGRNKDGAEGKGQDVQMCLCLTGQRSADTWKVLILLKSSMSAALVGVALH